MESFEKKVRAIGKSCMMAGNNIGQHITVWCFGSTPVGTGMFCSSGGMIYFFAAVLLHYFC